MRGDPRAPVRLLRQMLEIPSPSGGEEQLAKFVAAEMSALGYDARVDAAGNAVGQIVRGAGTTVLLVGHLDAVGEQTPVRVADGRIHGRGAVDAKGPLAAMICAGRTAAFRGRVVVAGVVEEELPGSRGAHALARAHPPPDALLIGEPSGWSCVVLGYKGKLDLRYRVRCPSAHPTAPVPRAVELAAQAWAGCNDLVGPERSHTRFSLPGTTLTRLEGDQTAAEAEFSIRTPTGFDSGRLVADLRARLPVGELEVVAEVAACRVGRADPVVRALCAGIRSQGAEPGFKVKTATSDMNTLAEYWSVPMACYGPGDSRLDHTEDEYLECADLVRSIGALAAALERLGTAVGKPGERSAT